MIREKTPSPAALGLALAFALPPGTSAAAWSPETNLSQTVTDSETGLGHRALAFDANGALHVVWAEQDSPNQQYRIWTRRRSGSNWTPSELIVDYLPTDPGGPGDELGAKYPGLALAADGTLHLFWHDYRIGGIDNCEIYTKARPSGGVWDPSRDADVRLTNTSHPETNGDNGYVPVPIATPTGDVHVAWYDYRWDGSHAEILAKTRPAGGAWDLTPGDSADGRVTNDAAQSELVDLAADPAGDVFAVWRSVDAGADILFSRRDASSGQWSVPEPVTTQATAAGAPAIAVDGAGTVHVVWPDSRDGGRALFTRTWTAAGGWSPDEEARLTRPAQGGDEPSLASSAVGTLHLVWSDAPEILLNREIFYREKTTGAPWDTTYASDTRLSDASRASTRPSVAVSGVRVAVVWRDERDFQNEIYARWREPEETAAPAPPVRAGRRLLVRPNPSRGPVRLRIAELSEARITVRDVAGRRVADVRVGADGVTWQPRDSAGRALPAGTYFLSAPGLQTTRVTVLR